jgi:hypothetical protein
MDVVGARGARGGAAAHAWRARGGVGDVARGGRACSSTKCWWSLLTVNSCIKVRLDLQADKSPVIVKGPFFPRVVNPRYRIRRTNVWRKRWSSKAK